AGRYGVPVWAHELTARALQNKVRVDRFLREGDRLDLGLAPDGVRAWHMEVLHTPGHAAGHLGFYDPLYRLLIAGDMVSMLSSVVLAPPDGDLTQYLASLRRLRSLDVRMLFPGHGSATIRPRQVLDESLAHRAKREQQLLEALADGQPHSAEDLA